MCVLCVCVCVCVCVCGQARGAWCRNVATSPHAGTCGGACCNPPPARLRVEAPARFAPLPQHLCSNTARTACLHSQHLLKHGTRSKPHLTALAASPAGVDSMHSAQALSTQRARLHTSPPRTPHRFLGAAALMAIIFGVTLLGFLLVPCIFIVSGWAGRAEEGAGWGGLCPGVRPAHLPVHLARARGAAALVALPPCCGLTRVFNWRGRAHTAPRVERVPAGPQQPARGPLPAWGACPQGGLRGKHHTTPLASTSPVLTPPCRPTRGTAPAPPGRHYAPGPFSLSPPPSCARSPPTTQT